MSKILFIYPNGEGYPIIPISISIMSGILKANGHKVDLFDATFMMAKRCDHEAREKAKVVEKVNVQECWGAPVNKVDLGLELQAKIKTFSPDIIAVSVLEDNYLCAKKLIDAAKKCSGAVVIVGGLFPTVLPQLFINDSNIDFVCIGEGEYAITELANNIENGKDILKIRNIVVKKGGEVIINPLGSFYDWEPNIFQDWEIFDERHLLKPFMGKMRRTGFFEMSRGCPFNCSYCTNKILQSIFQGLGRYNRHKPINYAIEEMEYMKNRYNLDLIFFNDENFLSMDISRLDEFCDQYKKRISLPFFIMTRADSLLDEEKIRKLKDAACHTVGIGVESGNEEIRKKVMNKKIPNSVYEKAFKNCHKYGIRTTANVMMGLPFETEENILESAAFVKKLEARSLSISIFAPYCGTKLRDVCIKNGYMEDKLCDEIGIINNSILKMPQISAKRIEELYCQFNDLVYGEKGA